MYHNYNYDYTFPTLHTHNRMGEPEECAGTVVFLCSDDASYVTGEVVAIAGGMLSRL